jgi:tetratricopeptide (TPR) repeat protein
MYEGELLRREGALESSYLQSAISRANTLREHHAERELWELRGSWHQANDQHEDAIRAFEKAIQMARSIGLSDDSAAAAQRALSLARIGLRADAEAAARSVEGRTMDVALAELWMALDQRDKALDRALDCYRHAWADGPPHFSHWQLEASRAVLRSLDQAEPTLPPFDPAGIAPLPYEAEIRNLLDN